MELEGDGAPARKRESETREAALECEVQALQRELDGRSDAARRAFELSCSLQEAVLLAGEMKKQREEVAATAPQPHFHQATIAEQQTGQYGPMRGGREGQQLVGREQQYGRQQKNRPTTSPTNTQTQAASHARLFDTQGVQIGPCPRCAKWHRGRCWRCHDCQSRTNCECPIPRVCNAGRSRTIPNNAGSDDPTYGKAGAANQGLLRVRLYLPSCCCFRRCKRRQECRRQRSLDQILPISAGTALLIVEAGAATPPSLRTGCLRTC
eukprot:GHVU01054105.1.p1 GENE.GHVU01054105.1~~GHVU01054105.1.p1  ORF type:complete len:266 (+),score=21.40 GHVU01054105.1:43-840(+)